MDIAALGVAVAYLVLVVAGAAVMLSILVWLFRDAPATTEKIGRERIEGSPSAERSGSEGAPSASIEPERWEDEAA